MEPASHDDALAGIEEAFNGMMRNLMRAANGASQEENSHLSGNAPESAQDSPKDTQAVVFPPSSSTAGSTSHLERKRMSRLRARRIISSAFRLYEDSSSGATSAKRNEFKKNLMTASPRALAADEYLRHSGLQFYLEDLLGQMQQEIELTEPGDFLAFITRYFETVLTGDLVAKRKNFEFVNKSLLNRMNFLISLDKSFAKLKPTQLEMTVADFEQVMLYHCGSELPSFILSQSICHLQSDSERSTSTKTFALVTFVRSFSLAFFYNEIVNKIWELYHEMEAVKEIHMTLSPRSQNAAVHAMAAERIVTRLRVYVQQNAKCCVPSLAQVESIIYKSPMFAEFCRLLYENDAIWREFKELQTAIEYVALPFSI